jgi:hypothetical protein
LGSLAKKLEAEVATWPNVTVGPHQFVAREFRFNKAEIGHVHFWGDVDIPFPPAVHDVLLAEGRAQRHRWLPDSGWVTYHLHNDSDLKEAVLLMRISYLRYALKTASDPENLLRVEAERMQLSPELQKLMAQFGPVARAKPVLKAVSQP